PALAGAFAPMGDGDMMISFSHTRAEDEIHLHVTVHNPHDKDICIKASGRSYGGLDLRTEKGFIQSQRGIYGRPIDHCPTLKSGNSETYVFNLIDAFPDDSLG